MKRLASIILVAVSLFTISLQAQNKLADSRRSSAKYYIYSMNRGDLLNIYLKDKDITEDMLGQYITAFTDRANTPELPRGNYVIVNTQGNQLNVSDYTVDDLYFRIVPSEQLMLCLYDSLGNIIKDAIVKCGAKSLKYDKVTQTYNTKSVKDEQVLEINNKGVYHYVEIGKNDYYHYGVKKNIFQSAGWKMKHLWRKTKNGIRYLFNPAERPKENKYTGFLVFSKPTYKPGETVKLKAYMTGHNGKPCNKPVDVRLDVYRPFRIDTVLTTINPYRPGMYEYQFQLTDSLNLSLDSYCSIYLNVDHKRSDYISNSFRYEEYELKGINFSMETDKDEYACEEPVKVKFNVTDENEMAVYDGRIELLVTSYSISSRGKTSSQVGFVPDTLWLHTVNMDGATAKEIELPDSIFPPGVSISYNLNATWLGADNEKKMASKLLFRNNEEHTLDFSLTKGMLTINELHKGKPQETMALITIEGENDELISTDSVSLPHTIPVPWFAACVTVKTKNTYDYFFADEDEITQDQISALFYRHNDSLYLRVDNPADIPFWYTIRRKNKEIARGYTTQLDYAIKDKGNNGYNMHLTYIMGEETKVIKYELPLIQKNISMNVSTPTIVYPGQKADVLVSVTDKKGKPVDNVDITAYSYTTKFQKNSMPNIPIHGKTRYAKQFKTIDYEADEEYIINRKSTMNWNHWNHTMTLDTIEYYKFLYPDTAYFYTEPTANRSTLLSPYIVIDGALQGVHMLWIDNRLYYTNKAEQLGVYTFEVEPDYHHLKFRTHNREIIVSNVFIKRGMKNIISFNADGAHIGVNPDDKGSTFIVASRLLDKSMQGELTEEEVDLLSKDLITVDNNFGRIELPNISQAIDIPAYISTGRIVYYLNHASKNQYNHTLRSFVNSPILAGPFPKRNVVNGLSNMAWVYAEDKTIANIELEGGNRYTVYPGYQKIKSWDKPPFDSNIAPYTPQTDFRQQPLNVNDIKEYINNRLMNVLKGASGAAEGERIMKDIEKQNCRLNLYLDENTGRKPIQPVLVFIMPEKEEEIANYRLYYGGTRHFKQLPAGRMNVSLIFNDSTSYTKAITLREGGENYINLDSIQYDTNSEIVATAFRVFNRGVKKIFTSNPYYTGNLTIDSIMKAPQPLPEKKKNGNKSAISGVVRDGDGEPIIGASVLIAGTTVGTITDIDGYFELPEGTSGDKLVISYIGYQPYSTKLSGKSYYDIKLKEDHQMLDEVVVIGYGVQKKSSITGSVSEAVVPTLAGAMSGLMIRGSASINNNDVPPLVIVNGLPFQGRLNDIDPSNITTIEILKAATAVGIYGSQAANGAIIIHTNDLRINVAKQENDEFPSMEAGNTMRRDFHDDAFWQPRLRTNEKGEASFEVTYPDDITSWDAYFVAIGNKKQTDKRQMTIKSFKALAARLSTPRFAVRGDSLNVVGKITNHLGDTISVSRRISIKGKEEEQKENLTFATSYVDHIPVTAETGDSLTIAYSLQMDNGYFDGEERSLPIMEQGMLQTHGEFKILNDTSTYVFNANPTLGNITIHAEASSLELFLREIEKVDSYPYMCNEQIASKIKALLLKRRIAEMFGKEFKDEKKITNLINRLNKNKNAEGFWGWWNKGDTEFWISEQVLNALFEADKAGYNTSLDKLQLINLFENELKQALSALQLTTPAKAPLAKQGLLDRLLSLKRLDAPLDYKGYFQQINEQLENRNVTDLLKTMEAMCAIGLKDEVNVDSLMYYSRKTMLGSMFWGDVKEESGFYRHFMLPYNSNTNNTLIAYNILKAIGGYETEMEKVRNYFFERRQGNGWANTYESSRIIETIMPDMLTGKESYSETLMSMNDRNISKFPFTDEITSHKPLRIKKEGTMPLYITIYQQVWNAAPQPESTKGFAVETVFKENGDTICSLTTGKTAWMEILVKVEADAEYVQIEVPIPAGCSYESKSRNYWKEVHREHFKDKVVIFCNKLSAGEHRFMVELIPRYSGSYSLNPAKAELMYFPVFYGNNVLKRITLMPDK